MQKLTEKIVLENGWNKLSSITEDMLKEYNVIEEGAFWNCESLMSITIPNSITSIGKSAFAYCKSLRTITIPNSIKSIEFGTFSYCKSLRTIIIPNSVTSIGCGAFYNCSSLTSIIIPNSVTSIRSFAFEYCFSLTSITIGDNFFKRHEIVDSKCKAYKGFKPDLTCRDYQYKEGETFIMEEPIEMCKQGFHACLNLKNVFNYYSGEIGKDFVIHEVELENVQTESVSTNNESKVVGSKITIGKRIL